MATLRKERDRSGQGQKLFFDIEGHARRIFLASSFTLCLSVSGRATRTWLPKLNTQPTTSSLSATLSIIFRRPSFDRDVSWLGCQLLSFTQAAAFLENSSSTSMRLP